MRNGQFSLEIVELTCAMYSCSTEKSRYSDIGVEGVGSENADTLIENSVSLPPKGSTIMFNASKMSLIQPTRVAPTPSSRSASPLLLMGIGINTYFTLLLGVITLASTLTEPKEYLSLSYCTLDNDDFILK